MNAYADIVIHRVSAARFAVSAHKHAVLALKEHYFVRTFKPAQFIISVERIVAEHRFAAVDNKRDAFDVVFAAAAKLNVLFCKLTGHIICAYKAHILKNAENLRFSRTRKPCDD